MSFGIDRRGPMIAVRGELDLSTAPDLRSAILEAITEHPGECVVVDLNGVEFIDSIGFGVLIGGRRRAQGEDGDLVLVNSGHMVRHALEVTGLTRVFEIHDSVEEASSA